jgi:hypothetical protein
MEAIYSDNTEKWSHKSYNIEIVGVATKVGYSKLYGGGYGIAPTRKYFMLVLGRQVLSDFGSVEQLGEEQEWKVMVNCDSDTREINKPSAGANVHMKGKTKGDGWISLSAKAPYEFDGTKDESNPEVFRGEKEVWIEDKMLFALEERDRSFRIGWVAMVNADDELPEELAFLKKMRNDAMAFHWGGFYETKNGVLGCGTVTYGGNSSNFSNCKEDVTCKRCLQKLGEKDLLIDVFFLTAFMPKSAVRRTATGVVVKEWIWKAKLEESQNGKGWWMDKVERARKQYLKAFLQNIVDKNADVHYEVRV